MAAVGGQSPSLEKRKKTSHGGREEKKRKDYPRIHVALLRPTQFNVGYSQVEKLVTRTNAQLAQCKSGKERKRLLRELNRKKKAPVVVGPGDQLYLIDHHHWCRALWESEVKFSRKKVYYYIISDLSHLSPDDFWAEMKRNKWVYLNSRGEPRNPEQLPEDVTGLEDDPFRSLARVVRGKRKGWKKTRLPFTEFLWADYLRMHSASFVALAKEIRFDSKENRAAFELAVQLCRAGEAASLPGYLGKPTGEPEAMIVSV